MLRQVIYNLFTLCLVFTLSLSCEHFQIWKYTAYPVLNFKWRDHLLWQYWNFFNLQIIYISILYLAVKSKNRSNTFENVCQKHREDKVWQKS